jgi:hypothetical protein
MKARNIELWSAGPIRSIYGVAEFIGMDTQNHWEKIYGS